MNFCQEEVSFNSFSWSFLPFSIDWLAEIRTTCLGLLCVSECVCTGSACVRARDKRRKDKTQKSLMKGRKLKTLTFLLERWVSAFVQPSLFACYVLVCVRVLRYYIFQLSWCNLFQWSLEHRASSCLSLLFSTSHFCLSRSCCVCIICDT